MKCALLLLVAASACKVDTPMAREHAVLDDLSFDVPAGWSRTETRQHGLDVAEWRPADGNEHKESVTVMRTERSPAIAKAGVPALEPYLRAAQRSLPRVQMRAVKQVATVHGLSGVRVDVDFVPAGTNDRYRRVHAVLVDGPQLVHVLYTARLSDGDTDAFDVVLDNLAHQEG